MLRRISIIMFPVIALFFLFIFMVQPARANRVYGEYVEYDSQRYGTDYYGDRISTQYRRGYQVDDWIERGDSSVTDSPLFQDGIRLASWASRYEDDFSYALANAIYFFDIPRNARSIRVKISYDGEGDKRDSDSLAGRVWIKRARVSDDYTQFYPREGRYEEFEKPLYGDTFVLRERKNYEIIRLSADDHVVNDSMELHVVAEGGQRIDIKYIEVETYTYLPTVRVVTRYYSDYEWRPWYNYTYWYFYAGPMYHFSDYYYIRYTYPNYNVRYVEIRKRYNQYLTIYHTTYINRPYVGWAHVNVVPRGANRNWNQSRLSKWTPSHEQARRTYSTTVTTTKTRPTDVQRARESFRSVLTTRTRLSPAETRAVSTERTTTIQTTRQTAPARTDRSVETRVNRSTEPSTRTTIPEVRRGVETRSSSESSSRIQRSEQKSTESRAPARSSVGTQTETRTREESTRSSVRTPATPSQTESKVEVRRSTSRTESSSSSTPQTRVRSESSRSSVPEKKEAETKKVESRSQSQSQAPAKTVETSKEKEDDEEKDKNKSSSSSSSRIRSEIRR